VATRKSFREVIGEVLLYGLRDLCGAGDLPLTEDHEEFK
jgi:hypothetical protein